MARTVKEMLDSKLAQDTHDYCQEPEMETCQRCGGTGKNPNTDWDEGCMTCDGTGRILKVRFTIEEG